MVRTLIITGGLTAALLTTSSAARQATPPNQPGQPTVARVVVLNRLSSEAVPVVLQAGVNPIPVSVISAPVVSLAANATVGTTRQQWEYRHLTFKSGEDVAAGLTGAGTDGWEAVGMTTVGVTGVQVLLKRPR